ncbi:CotH kinase family protein [Brevibacillus nitrificans]|uniref:CotH kinase family protein n=1 Tax=Brevibacillus nitrificans TaxID=651560 RepID=UPI0028613AEC|nr:CotH kinase family protein [Brevibacillus nitrificans]MDR7315822.1 spore coat protein CotH [Brevibacillus nitrificans]
MKNKYIVASVAFMLVIFIVVMGVLPKLGVTISGQGQTYATDVFDQSKVTTVDISVDEADFKKMLENPLDEVMYSADVVINGEKVENVGFRTKGNLTLRSVAQMDDSDRYSWKIDFDKYVDEQNLHGLKKLNLNNNYSDPSQMREYLAYSLMKKMGIPTPNFSYMYVTINGKEWGVYLGVEAIEETFLQQNFENARGDLYKPDGTGSDLKWISDDISDYSGMNLKTNKDTKDQSELIEMLDAINHGGDIEKVLDVDEMLRYFAVNTAVVNLDHYQGSLKHNYYLYEENGVFSILPWDYNMSFGGFGVGGMGGAGGGRPGEADQQNAAGKQAANTANANQAAGRAEQAAETTADQAPGTANQAADANQDTSRTAANKTENGQANGQREQNPRGGMGGMGDMAANFLSEANINFSITTPVSGTTLEDRPLLNALLSVDEYRAKYNEYLKEIATNYFTEEYMGTTTADIANLITPYVEKDPTKFYTTEQFKESVSGEKSLVQFAVKRAASISAQLSGDLVVEASTSSGMGGPGDGANPGEPPQMGDGQNQDNMQPPQMGNEQNRGERPPMGAGGPGGRAAANQGYSMTTIMEISSFIVILIVGIVYAFFYKRRRS